MYQTLYRKYRPKNFNEVVGQKIIVQTLRNAIKNNTLTHAYLFTGPRGTGKTSVAKILAKTINCYNLKDEIPCEECESCKQIQEHQAIDILEIDAASNNGVDKIREIRNKVNLVPSVGKYKVYIIDEVHMLTKEAFNALLKTLEEPPNHIIFILATTEPHEIPATILSRCQRFDFKKIPYKQMFEYLKKIAELEKVNIDDNSINEIVRLSDGCMRDALSILDQVIAFAPDKITEDDVHEVNGTLPQKDLSTFISSLLNKDYKTIFEMVDIYDNKGKSFVKLTEEIILFLRNILILVSVPDYFETLNYDITIYKDISNQINEQLVFQYINIFNKIIPDMKKTNRARIIFEMALIEIISEDKKQPEINKKLEIKEEIKEIKIEPKPEENKPIISQKKHTFDSEIIKEIRVNNTLCNFNKNRLKELKERIDEIRSLIINPEYSEYASMVIDGDLRALGNENMIFVFPSKRDSNQFNENIVEIDNMLKDYFDKEYKTISVSTDEWEIIKQEYNSKKKQYTYIEEPQLDNQERPKNELEELFGEIIEYL